MAKATKSTKTSDSPVKKSAKKAAAKKAASPKTAGKNAATGIKYNDKSTDQPELQPIFTGLKKLLLPYVKGKIVQRGGDGGQIILVSEKPVEINGKKRDGYWFVALLIQRGYVGFYFMPAETKKEKEDIFQPELLKCLKGKSCFHIKKSDPVLLKQVETALAKGYQACLRKGWI
jgi:hypothetical protein